MQVAEESVTTLESKVREPSSTVCRQPNPPPPPSETACGLRRRVCACVQLAEAESALKIKIESLVKASARNKEVTFMLAWLERQYAQLDQGHQQAQAAAQAAEEELGRERTVNARARADLAMLKARMN